MGPEVGKGRTGKRLPERLWDQADKFLVRRTIQQSEAACVVHAFVQHPLGAAASLEALFSFENVSCVALEPP